MSDGCGYAIVRLGELDYMVAQPISDEIERLRSRISDYQDACRQKDEILNSEAGEIDYAYANRRDLAERAWKDGNSFAFEGCNVRTTDDEFDAAIARRIDEILDAKGDRDE